MPAAKVKLKVKLFVCLYLLFGYLSVFANAECSVSVTPVNFGEIDVFGPDATEGKGDITVQCSGDNGDVSYSISISSGNSGTTAQRFISSANRYKIFYNLYLNPSDTIVAGDGNAGSQLINGSCKLSNKICTSTNTVYGRIPPHQTSAGVGEYSDNLTVSLTY